MIKSILTTALTLCSIVVLAQQHLPAKVTITLTDKEVMVISNKIDSVNMLLQNSDYPVRVVNPFVNRLQVSFAPFWSQVRKQLVADSVKKEKKH